MIDDTVIVLEAPPVLPADTSETVAVPAAEDHPFMSTSFAEYSVTEGLLLLIFVLLFLSFFIDLIRRWF